ncbi:antibiotic biosynthesis monooxygenase family protein [Streptomyces scopuliridis]
MEIFPGLGPGFEATWLEVGRAIAREPANLGQMLVRAVEEEDVYYVVTDWTDEPGFRAFERSQAHIGHRLRIGPFRRRGEMVLTQGVFELPGREARATG